VALRQSVIRWIGLDEQLDKRLAAGGDVLAEAATVALAPGCSLLRGGA
jgi:hypothetical protein